MTTHVKVQGINGLVLGERTFKSFILLLLCAWSCNKYLSSRHLVSADRTDLGCFLSQPHPFHVFFFNIWCCLCESSRLWCMNILEEKKKKGKLDFIFLTTEMLWNVSSADSTVGMYVSKNVTDIQREYPWQPLGRPTHSPSTKGVARQQVAGVSAAYTRTDRIMHVANAILKR